MRTRSPRQPCGPHGRPSPDPSCTDRGPLDPGPRRCPRSYWARVQRSTSVGLAGKHQQYPEGRGRMVSGLIQGVLSSADKPGQPPQGRWGTGTCIPYRPGAPDRQPRGASGAAPRSLRRLTSIAWVSVLTVNTWPPEAAHNMSSAITRLRTGKTPNFITF